MALTPTLNPTLNEEKTVEDILFVPSIKEKDLVSNIFNKFTISFDDRNRAFSYFDDRNIIEYIDDSVKRLVTNIDERDQLEPWQSRAFQPFTRNKFISILAKASQNIPRSDVSIRGEEDSVRSEIIGNLLDFSNDMDDEDELMFYSFLEALGKGTVIGYEGYEEKETKVRDVIDYDSGDDIKIKTGTKKTRKVFGTIIPLEDFVPQSVGIRKIKDMVYCFWRTTMPLSQFKMDFAQYKKSEMVLEFRTLKKDEEKPFYLDYVSSGVSEGDVEVIRYYNQDTDEFVIIANGVWLNPIQGEQVSPLPFNHKKLPFWKAIFEPLGADFFYGKSQPDKLKSSQDVMNVLYNMMLDQSFLSIFPPILMDNMDEIEDDILVPGRRIPINDMDKSPQELRISSPDNFHSFILNYTKRVLEESSLDPVQQGVGSDRRERVTATEIQTTSESVGSILGMFITFMRWGKRDKDELRVKNILQFYNKPLIEKVLGQDETKKFNDAFNVFKIDDVVLTTGKRGTKIIQMFKNRNEMPTGQELAAKAKILTEESGKRIQLIAITPEYIRNVDVDVKIPGSKGLSLIERALVLEKVRVYKEVMPEQIDNEELAVMVAEAFGDNPEKVLKKSLFVEEQEQAPIDELGRLEKELGMNQRGGESAISNNLVRGATGGESLALNVRDLVAT